MKNIMKKAWEIRKESAKKYNCPVMEIIFGICLKMAWAESKKESEMENKQKTYEVSGQTFKYKEKIKKAGGKWNALRKVWTVGLYKGDFLWKYDGRLVFKEISGNISENGICPKCKTYCYGDCAA